MVGRRHMFSVSLYGSGTPSRSRLHATAEKVKVNALFCINQVVNFVFFADMILQFFLHVQLPKHKGGVWIRNHKKIIKRYLKGAFFCGLCVYHTLFCLDVHGN